MSDAKIAERYAEALMDLCKDTRAQQDAEKNLRDFIDALNTSDSLRALLPSPVISKQEKRGVIEALASKLGFKEQIRNFLLVLLDHDRLDALKGIAQQLSAMIDAAANRVQATVTSAVALEKNELDPIRKEAERLTGKTVVMTTQVDASIMGGVVTKIGNVVLDGSVRTDLEMLRESLLR